MNTEAERLIDAYIDGSSTKEEREELVRMLKSDTDLMDMYVDRVRLHSLLREVSTEETEFASPFPDLHDDLVEPKFARMLKPIAAVLVLGFALLFALLMYLHKSDPPDQDSGQPAEELKGTLTRNGESQDLADRTKVQPGDIISTGPGRKSDEIMLFLEDDSVLSIGSETEIAVVQKNRLTMSRGILRCSITPQQKDFKVDVLPVKTKVRVVGTEFIIECIGTKGEDMKQAIITAALITVLSGTVGVTPAGEREILAEAGARLQVNAQGKVTELEKREKPSRKVSELEKKLSKRLSFSFGDMPLTEAVSYFQQIGECNIIVDARALGGRKAEDISIQFEAKDITLENALFWTARKVGLVCAVEDNAVAISSEKLYPNHWKLHEKGEEQTKWHQEIREKMEKKTTFDFVETPFEQVMSFLSKVTGLTLIVDHGIDLNGKNVTLRVNDMKMDLALKWITRLAGCNYTIAREAVLISNKKDIKGDWDRKLELERKEQVEKRKAIIDERNRKVAEQLEQKISLNLANADIGFTFETLRKITGVTIVLAPAVLTVRNEDGRIIHRKEKITVNANNISFEETLNMIVKQIPGCVWTVKNGSVYVYIKETLKPVTPAPSVNKEKLKMKIIDISSLKMKADDIVKTIYKKVSKDKVSILVKGKKLVVTGDEASITEVHAIVYGLRKMQMLKPAPKLPLGH
ncbi:hypothetical protein ACFL6F_00620 [Planctomycetota bacterium]